MATLWCPTSPLSPSSFKRDPKSYTTMMSTFFKKRRLRSKIEGAVRNLQQGLTEETSFEVLEDLFCQAENGELTSTDKLPEAPLKPYPLLLLQRMIGFS